MENKNAKVWENWKANSHKMKAWFNALESIPESPLRINSFSIINDVKKYIETNISIMMSNQHTQWPAPFKPAYMRLYELKKFIENEQPGIISSKP